jgi:hypothetical protein
MLRLSNKSFVLFLLTNDKNMLRKELSHLPEMVVMSFGKIPKAVNKGFTLLIYIPSREFPFPSPKMLFDPP